MQRMVQFAMAVSLLILLTGCGYAAGATFNGDGSVTVTLKFLFPKSLVEGGSSSASVQGMSSSDIQKANAKLASQYPGGSVKTITEGDQAGALVTIPFKNEQDAFRFLTQPPTLSTAAASATASASGIDLANTGGLFTTANHTKSGATDTYTFKTQPPPTATPSPGDQNPLGPDVLDSIFTVTFSLTTPGEITSAPGALFSADRKTAIWTISLVTPQTLEATTGPATATAGGLQQPSGLLLAGVALVAVGIGFVSGLFTPWRRSAQGSAPSPALPVPGFGPPPGYTPPS